MSQGGDLEYSGIIEQIRSELDHARKRKKNRDQKVQGAGLKPLEMEYYRSNHMDGVLERKVNMAIAVIWVPVIPDDMMEFLSKMKP